MTAIAAGAGVFARESRLPRPGPYLAYFAAGVRQEIDARAALVARAGFLVVILFIFSRVWDVVLSGGVLGSRSAADLVWYIAITEWVVLSTPALYLDMENDLRSGDLVARLPQPVSYAGARLAEAAGSGAIRLLVLGATGVVAATALSGGLPGDPSGLLLAVPLGVGGALLALVAVGIIGSCAVWLQDTSPIYWVWQKLAFMLGGLLLPLEIYPGWLRSFAEWTPFAAMINGPGRMAFGFDASSAGRTALTLACWLVVAAALLAWTWSRALRALDAHGG